MKKFLIAVILFFLFLRIGIENLCFAQAPTASQIERTREDLEKDRVLRETIEKGQKVFIKKIIVRGVTLLSEKQIREIILPFQKHWLTQEDIQHIIDSLKESYQKQSQQIPEISYRIEGRKLIIEVIEEKR